MLRRAASWLDGLVTAPRVRAYAIILLIGCAIGLGLLASGLRHGLDPQGKPLGADFIIFQGVSTLTLKGEAALAYAPHALLMAERTIVPASRGIFLWCYPPTFQLVVWPLALAPYPAALAAWSALGAAAYAAMLARFRPGRRGWLLAAAFPGVYVCVIQGQTGLLLAGLMGGGLLMLDESPWLAGAILGLLAIKPQYGVLLPLLLIGTGRWKAVAGAAASSCLLVVAATLAFGLETWSGFIAAGGAAGRALIGGGLPLYKDPSAFTALLGLGAPLWLAAGLHFAQALAAAALAWSAWRKEGSLEIKAGAAVLATLIVLPYVFDYDLTLLAIPLAAGLRRVTERPAPPGARSGLAVLALLPIAQVPLARWLHLPVGPLALWWGLLALLACQAGESRAPPDAETVRQNVATA
jgi:hypothetical protein